MKHEQRVGALGVACLLYVGALAVFVAPHAYGANVALHAGLLVGATVTFLMVWRYLADTALPVLFALCCGLVAGVAIGIVELALASLSASAETPLAVGSVEFGGAFVLLLGLWLASDAGTAGSFLTRRRHVQPGMALGAGMWLGAVLTILIAVLLAMSFGVRGSLSG